MKNKKQLIALLFVALLVCCVAVTLVACNGFGGTSNNQTDTDDNGNGKIDSGTTDKKAMVTDIQGGTVDGLNLYLEVDTTISMVDLSGMITTSKDSSWQLYEDVLGQKLIPTKYAAPLCDGNNTYYIVVNSSDGTINRTYTLVIYKNYYVTMSYYVDEKLFDTQKVLARTTLGDFRHPTKNGYTFVSWDCEGVYVTENQYFNAKFKLNTYDIKYNLNGGTNNSNNPSTYTTESSTITLETPSRNGYTFAGWYSDRGLTNKVTTIETGSYGDKTLYAKWTPTVYTISYNLNGGSVSGTNPTSYTIESDDISLINPTKFGCVFLGWSGTGIEGKSSSVKIAKCSYGNRNYTANWQAVEEMSNFEFISTDTTCTITGIKDKTVTSIVVPDYVTSIGEYAFYGCSKLTSVTIGNGVTSIGSSAFDGCDKLVYNEYDNAYYLGNGTNPYVVLIKAKNTSITSCEIHPNTKVIYYAAFQNCSKLTSITIPDSVKSIGNYAFYDCSGLTAVYITDLAAWCNISFGGSSANPLYYANNLYLNGELVTNLVIPEEVTSIGNYAFYKCSGLTSVTIPDSVESIGECAFEYCSGLTSITIPDGVTSIGYETFYGCSGLTRVTIGNSVTSIGNYAFYKCSGLTSVTIPDSVESIGECAFEYCSGLTSITIPDSVTSIGRYAFSGCSGLTSVTIGNGVTSIGSYAFAWCSGLKMVTIGKSVTSIGSSAFSGCSGLTSITIPDSVTRIGEDAFDGCDKLVYNEYDNAYYLGNGTNPYVALIKAKNTSITSCKIHSNTKVIYYAAFQNRSKLTSITIPDGVTSIGYRAFYNCSGLTSVTIGNSVTSIGSSAFSGCSGLTSVTIGNSVTSIGEGAFYGCDKLVYNEYDNGYYLGNGTNPYVALIKAKNTSITSCEIHPNTKVIYMSAFSGCSGLTSITIPNSVTSIGDDAFYECSGLTSIEIPNSVTSIGGYYAFYGCSGLTSITIPDSVTSIGYGAFSGCSGLTSVTIGNSVTSIGDNAFNNCSGLTSVTIGNSVTSIGSYAFSRCSGLTSITYKGTIAQWNAISKGSNWKYNVPSSCKVHCTDGDVNI